MKVILVTLLFLTIISSVGVEVNIDDTVWHEKKTDRPIYVIRYNSEEGVVYSYPEDGFTRRMSLLKLIKDFKYGGYE